MIKIIQSTIFSIFLIVLVCCKDNEPNEEPKLLELINSYSIDVDEPSGLVHGPDNKSLFTVSDRKSKVFRLDLTGRILEEIQVPGTDLEGISFNPKDNTIWLVSELQGEVIQVDTLGNELQRRQIAGVRDGSGGLEGITINTQNDNIFLIKEKDPSAFIKLNKELDILLFKRIASAQDYSGMDYNERDNEFWIISDQEKELYRFDINGKSLESFPIDVEKAEGVAFDDLNNLIYIISDATDSLYVYRLNRT